MGGEGADEGRWIEFVPGARGWDDNILQPSFWLVIVDLAHSYPVLLSGPVHWNPTVAWTVTFHGRIPPRSEDRSDTTAGLYTHTKSVVDQDSWQVL